MRLSYAAIEAREDDEGQDVLTQEDHKGEQSLGGLTGPVLQAHRECLALHQGDLVKILNIHLILNVFQQNLLLGVAGKQERGIYSGIQTFHAVKDEENSDTW